MKTNLLISALLAATFVIGPSPIHGLSRSQENEPVTARERNSFAVGVLRVINTAELKYRQRNKVYASWSVLVTSEEFTSLDRAWAAPQNSQLATAHFSDGPEILPGWALRLNLTADKQGYDILLEDTTDTDCGYAALTDERGLIRQSKAIGCSNLEANGM
ncbi:MAG TPA: hypothetical protein VIH76_08195 [Candidatus Acidoferrales bacterium]